jgi:hypothetical protein
MFWALWGIAPVHWQGADSETRSLARRGLFFIRGHHEKKKKGWSRNPIARQKRLFSFLLFSLASLLLMMSIGQMKGPVSPGDRTGGVLLMDAKKRKKEKET